MARTREPIPMTPTSRGRLLPAIVTLGLLSLAAGCGDSAQSRPPASASPPAAPSVVSATGAAVGTPLPTAAPRMATVDRNEEAFKRVPIVDPGLGAPRTALTVEIPASWKPYGGIQWNRGVACITNQHRIEWGAASPDGTHAVELLPAFAWQVSGWHQQMNPCPVAPIGSVREYLQAVVGQMYPDAKFVGYRERADLLDEAGGARPQSTMPNMQLFNDAGEVTIAYASNGREMRESLTALAQFSEVASQGMRSRMGTVRNILVVRAPADDFDPGIAERVRRSIRTDPQWAQAFIAYGKNYVDNQGAQQSAQIARWHSQRMAEIDARGAADRAAIRTSTIREVGEINAAGWKARQESQDRMHRNRVDTIREVQRYQDPSGNRQVELSSHYNYGWKTDGGHYVASNDPNFDPGAGGVEMKRAP